MDLELAHKIKIEWELEQNNKNNLLLEKFIILSKKYEELLNKYNQTTEPNSNTEPGKTDTPTSNPYNDYYYNNYYYSGDGVGNFDPVGPPVDPDEITLDRNFPYSNHFNNVSSEEVDRIKSQYSGDDYWFDVDDQIIYKKNGDNHYHTLVRLVNNIDTFVLNPNTEIISNGAFMNRRIRSFSLAGEYTTSSNGHINFEYTNEPSLKRIEENAFKYLKIDDIIGLKTPSYGLGDIKYLIIPNTVEYIGDSAFSHSVLPKNTVVCLPSNINLTSIPESCFEYCGNPDEQHILKYYTYQYNSELFSNDNISPGIEALHQFNVLNYINIYDPENACIQLINSNCNNNISVEYFGRYVKSFGNRCFYGSTIKSIVLPSSTEELGEECFSNSTLKNIHMSPVSYEYNGNYITLTYADEELGDLLIIPRAYSEELYYIPSLKMKYNINFTKIPDKCFYNCYYLHELFNSMYDDMLEFYESNIKYIGNYAAYEEHESAFNNDGRYSTDLLVGDKRIEIYENLQLKYGDLYDDIFNNVEFPTGTYLSLQPCFPHNIKFLGNDNCMINYNYRYRKYNPGERDNAIINDISMGDDNNKHLLENIVINEYGLSIKFDEFIFPGYDICFGVIDLSEKFPAEKFPKQYMLNGSYSSFGYKDGFNWHYITSFEYVDENSSTTSSNSSTDSSNSSTITLEYDGVEEVSGEPISGEPIHNDHVNGGTATEAGTTTGSENNEQNNNIYRYDPDTYTKENGLVHIMPPNIFWGHRFKTIKIPDGTEVIGRHAVRGPQPGETLYHAFIPDSVREIHGFAFADNLRLRTLFIPENVKKISMSAFVNNYHLGNVYIASKNPPEIIDCNILTGQIIFSDDDDGRDKTYKFNYKGPFHSIYRWDDSLVNPGLNYSLTDKQTYCYVYNIYVPEESVDAYKNAPIWSVYAKIIQGRPASFFTNVRNAEIDLFKDWVNTNSTFDYTDEYKRPDHNPVEL